MEYMYHCTWTPHVYVKALYKYRYVCIYVLSTQSGTSLNILIPSIVKQKYAMKSYINMTSTTFQFNCWPDTNVRSKPDVQKILQLKLKLVFTHAISVIKKSRQWVISKVNQVVCLLIFNSLTDYLSMIFIQLKGKWSLLTDWLSCDLALWPSCRLTINICTWYPQDRNIWNHG